MYLIKKLILIIIIKWRLSNKKYLIKYNLSILPYLYNKILLKIIFSDQNFLNIYFLI